MYIKRIYNILFIKMLFQYIYYYLKLIDIYFKIVNYKLYKYKSLI